MDLRINQQFARIGLDIKHPAFDMEIHGTQTQLKITPPQIEIDQEMPRVEIDQTQCFADMGRRTPMELSRQMAEMSRMAGLEGIAQIAREGDLLAAIEKGVDIADVALMNSQDQDEFDVAAVPEHRPLIAVIRGNLHIDLQRGNVEVSSVNGWVKGYLDWGEVNVFWQQRPAIDIEYVGRRVDVCG
ncbi:MAG: DUF6470 family protein [Bacillota bacterium]